MKRTMRESLASMLGGSKAVGFLALVMLIAGSARAAETASGGADEPWLRPYSGPTRADIDATTLGRQGPLRLPGMVQHARRRHELRVRALGQGAGSARRRAVRGRHVARRFGLRPAGSVRGSGTEDARRLAGPALSAPSARARCCCTASGCGSMGSTASSSAASSARRPIPRGPATSTRCWPASARGATARDACGR